LWFLVILKGGFVFQLGLEETLFIIRLALIGISAVLDLVSFG